MKLLIVFACLVTLSAAYTKVHGEDNLRILKKSQRFEVDLAPVEQLFDKLVTLLKKFDPIHIEDKTIYDIFGLYLKVKNLHSEGFSNIITDISVDIGFPKNEIKFEMSLPEIFGSIESYDSNTPIIYGQASGSFSMKNAKISITIVYDLFGGLAPTVAVTSIEHANVVIKGFNNDEELSQFISDKLNYFLNDVINSPETHQTIGNVIDTVISSILGMKN